jgi:hypothetical protein
VENLWHTTKLITTTRKQKKLWHFPFQISSNPKKFKV